MDLKLSFNYGFCHLVRLIDGIRCRLPWKFRRRIVLERYFYDGADVIADYDLFGRRCKASYLTPFLDENLLVDRYFRFRRAGRYWYTQDGLGSVRQLISDSESVLNSYAYTAWGVPLQWHERVSNRYTYTGREYNPETLFYHYRIRPYQALNGRFSQRDDVRKYVNDYWYAVNNPLRYKDPLGLDVWLYDSRVASMVAQAYDQNPTRRAQPTTPQQWRAILEVGRGTNAGTNHPHFGPLEVGGNTRRVANMNNFLSAQGNVFLLAHGDNLGVEIYLVDAIISGRHPLGGTGVGVPPGGRARQQVRYVDLTRTRFSTLTIFGCGAAARLGQPNSVMNAILERRISTILPGLGGPLMVQVSGSPHPVTPAWDIFCRFQGNTPGGRRRAIIAALNNSIQAWLGNRNATWQQLVQRFVQAARNNRPPLCEAYFDWYIEGYPRRWVSIRWSAAMMPMVPFGWW